MIPAPEETVAPFKAVRDAQSSLSVDDWKRYFEGKRIELPVNSSHHIEVEFECHSTAFIRFIGDTRGCGASLKVTYFEAYEGQARDNVGGKRLKGDRTKREGNVLVGPSDTYRFRTTQAAEEDDQLCTNHFDGVLSASWYWTSQGGPHLSSYPGSRPCRRIIRWRSLLLGKKRRARIQRRCGISA
jgi:hypothetical protein